MGDSEQQWVAMGGCGRKLAGESRRAVTVHRWTMRAGECEGCLVADNVGRSVHPNVWLQLLYYESEYTVHTTVAECGGRGPREGGGNDSTWST